MMINEVEKTARYWKKMGIATLPIRWKSKSPEVRSWAEYTERIPSEEEIANWYVTPWHNIGVIAGWENLCILDFDEREKYYEWIEWAEKESIAAYTVWLTTRIVASARGVHLYFHTREKAQNMKLHKVDVLCDRKYALTAPSIHPSGAAYTVLQDLTPARVERIELMIPPKWLEEIEADKQQAAEDALMREAGMKQTGNSGQLTEMGVVERIKSRIRIEDFFPEAKPSGGQWYQVRCPLHHDEHPSAGINVEQQIFTCFNHCYGTKPLDVIGLYAKMKGIDNSSAIRELRQRIGD